MRPEKKQLVQDIQDLLTGSESYFLVTYRGLEVSGFSEFRAALDDVGGECHVVPIRLLRRAAEEAGQDALASETVQGDTALVTAGSEPVAVARTVRDFGKGHPEVAFKFGVVRGKGCTAEEARQIAGLPPREVLLGQLLGLLEAPASQLVRVLNAKAASIVYALNAYLNKKQETA